MIARWQLEEGGAMIRGIEPLYTYAFDDCDDLGTLTGRKRGAGSPAGGPPAKSPKGDGTASRLGDFFARNDIFASDDNVNDNEANELGNSNESTRPDHVPLCKCNKPSKYNIVRKDGPNKGKTFFTCDTCRFFDWQDKTKDASQRIQANISNNVTTGPHCKCNKPSVMRTVNKDGPNKGRNFWTCFQVKKENQCGYFLWIENKNPL